MNHHRLMIPQCEIISKVSSNQTVDNKAENICRANLIKRKLMQSLRRKQRAKMNKEVVMKNKTL